MLIFNSKHEINRIISDFLDKMEIPYNTQIKFFYNRYQIKLNEHSISIGHFFKNENNPKIIVKDPNNLIGKKIKINFKTNHGYKLEIISNAEKTIGNLIKSYLDKIDENFNSHRDYKFIEQILFFYKGQKINWYNLNNSNKNSVVTEVNYSITSIGDYFKNDNNPEIFVNDQYNLFLINWNEKKTYYFKK